MVLEASLVFADNALAHKLKDILCALGKVLRNCLTIGIC